MEWFYLLSKTINSAFWGCGITSHMTWPYYIETKLFLIRFGMILLIVKENYQLSLLRVDFGWINNNIKFSLKLVQIEITSTLPSVGWMWISICTHFNSNLILLFIHPYPPSKGWVNSYSHSFRPTNEGNVWLFLYL